MNAIPQPGDRYGSLTVQHQVGKGDNRGARYACRCDCGPKNKPHSSSKCCNQCP